LGNQKRRSAGGKLVAGCAIALLAAAIAAPGAQARRITIAPDSPVVSNCYPFGGMSAGDTWKPFMGFTYRNIPAFRLHKGDGIAFDLGAQNDTDIQLAIAMARTTFNGGIRQGQRFQRVVKNTQTPANPRGDTTVGDFELRFRAQAPFSFPGGGLIIRLSHPSHAYSQDTDCDQVLVGASASDPSGHFVERVFSDADGVFPWDQFDSANIGGFRLLLHKKRHAT
jgi:hypothetical protein